MGLKDNKQVGKNKSFLASLFHALRGIAALLKNERNFRFHLSVAVVVIVFSFWMKIRVTEWLWILLAIFAVLIAEVINTLCESIVDLVVGKRYNELAKRTKDIAAGGVVIAVIFAVIVGLIIFLPALFN